MNINDNSEMNEMVNNQKDKLTKITKQKEQLLLLESGSSEFDDLKKNLGWNDTDSLVEQEQREVIELESLQMGLVEHNILDEKTIYDYCIDNNYVIAPIKKYKGQLHVDLLKAIKDYSTNNDRRLESEANTNSLFILCPFSDVKENDGIKKSKRYKANELPKLLLLEKVSDSRVHTKEVFKVIFEIGTKKHITNKFNSLFKTLKSIDNFLEVFTIPTIIFLAIIFGTMIFIKDVDFIFYALPGLYITWNVISIGLFTGMILLSDIGHMYIDSKYDYLYNANWIYRFKNYSILNENKITKKLVIGSLLVIALANVIFYLTIQSIQSYAVRKTPMTTISRIDHNEVPYDAYHTFSYDSWFTQKETVKEYNMSPVQVEKRRIEAYNKVHPKK